MRVGIISDIHGDIDGLQRGLSFLERLGVDTLICSGDLVDRGRDSAGVIDIIRERQIPTVMGNHDQSAPSIERSMRKNPQLRAMYSADPLTDAQMTFLESLPQQLQFEWEGVSVFMAHGSPWDVSTYITPNVLTSVVRKVVNVAKTDLIILGHTHTPMIMETGAGVIINSGSLYRVHGRIFEFRRSCAVLELPAKTVTFYNIDDYTSFTPPTIKNLI